MMTKIYKIFIQSKVYKKLKAKQSSHVFIPLIKTRQTKKVRKKEVGGAIYSTDLAAKTSSLLEYFLPS